MRQVLNYTPPESLKPFLKSEHFISLVVGPVGSTKTTAGIMKIAYHAKRMAPCTDGVRRSKAIWIRNTREQLRDTSIPDFLKWFPDGKAGAYEKSAYRFVLKFDDVECEVLWRGLDDATDVKRVLSLQASFAIMDEFREINKDVFEALGARLGRYPDGLMVPHRPEWGFDDKGKPVDGCVTDEGKPNKHIWGMTNAPDADTFWEIYLSNPPKIAEVFFQPSGMSQEADWIQFLPSNYYEDISEGKSQDWIDVYVHAQFGRSLSGQPVFRSFNRDIHVAKQTLTPIRLSTHPLIIGQDFGLCYDDQTEVLTKAGWKLFKDVDETKDFVATLNPDKYVLEYTAVNFKVDMPYEGELIEFSSDNLNFCVTPEHRTPNTCRESPQTLRFDAAEALERGTAHRFIQLTAQPVDGTPMNLFGVPDEMAASFLGWYVSEGSTYVVGNSYRVSIAQTKPANDLAELMTDARWPWQWIKLNNTTGWRATVPPEVGRFLHALGKAADKHVPRELLEASGIAAREFIRTFIAGDGHVRSRVRVGNGIGRKPTGERTAATKSTRLKDELQILALRAGYASSARFQKAQVSTMRCGRKIHSNGVWVVNFKQITRAEITSTTARRVPYAGRVYCLNVPHHTLYVRRKGKPCWNGNTPACTISQIDPQGRLLTYADLVSDGMGITRFIREKLKPLLATRFAGMNVLVVGDPAGTQRAQTDEATVFDILKKEGFRTIAARSNSLVARISAVESWLTRMVDGKPAHLIDPGATHIIAALRGGYRYKVKQNGDTEDKPDKNPHSHVADAHQYGCMHADGNLTGQPFQAQARKIELRPFVWT